MQITGLYYTGFYQILPLHAILFGLLSHFGRSGNPMAKQCILQLAEFAISFMRQRL